MLTLNKESNGMLLEWVLRISDEKADQLLVELVSSEMTKKLKKKRLLGRRGWFGPNCSNAKLRRMLLEHVEKGDMLDVINLAGMMLVRQMLYGDSA